MSTPAKDLSIISPQTLLLIMTFLVLPYISFFFILHRFLSRKPAKFESAIVLVLGDFGRSPRMMYHAKSLVGHNWDAVVVAYGDTEPIPVLLESPHLHTQYLSSLPSPLHLLPWILRAPLRLVHQFVGVIYTVLWSIPFHTEFIIVQNPPSIPTLMLAQGLCMVTGSKLVIDWHNEGWSILALRVGERNPLVKLARWFEGTFGQVAYAHLFVTRALLAHLKTTFNLQGRPAVLYDRPLGDFSRSNAMQQHEVIGRLLPTITPPLPPSFDNPNELSTVFTTISKTLASLRNNRPALLVSSTSWTADEDFSLLLTALDAYQLASTSSSSSKLPHLLVLITGKGPLRTTFEKSVQAREASGRWTNVTARCLFVEARDYPTLMGCADLGVSLHTSSSGRDLPMKIVDMFGCGVPVLAKRFECLGELVKEGKNGRMFDSGEELGTEIQNLLSDFPKNRDLQTLQSYFIAQSDKPRSRAGTPVADPDEWTTWEKNWDRVVFKGILRQDRKK